MAKSIKFEDAISSRFQNFKKNLRRYIKYSNQDATHDVRVAFRRFQCAYSILPDRRKTEASENYFNKAQSFFQLNSSIRDLDITYEKLVELDQEYAEKVSSKLNSIRNENLKKSLEIAHTLDQMNFLFNPGQTHVRKNKFRSKINSRVDKFLENKDIVLNNETATVKLHEMRKNAKKLIYLLELIAGESNNADKSHLKRFQRLSGDLHDSDVVLTFLQTQPVREENPNCLEVQQETIRHHQYLELVDYLNLRYWSTLHNLGARTSID